MTKTAKNILELASGLTSEQIKDLLVELALLARNKARSPRFASEEELKLELKKRMDEVDAHPDRLIPLKQALREIKAELSVARKSGTRG